MGKTALLIIDIQNLLMGMKPRNKELFLETVNRLIGEFRAKDLPIVFIQHTNKKEIQEGSEAWQIYSEVDVRPEDKRMIKTSLSAFKKTQLREYLEEQGVDSLVLCGMQTEYCIDTTCRVAYEFGYRIDIPKNGTTTFDNDLLTAEQVQNYQEVVWSAFVKVKSVEEILEAIEH